MRAVISYSNYCIPDNHLSIEEFFNMLDDAILEKSGMGNMKREELAMIFKNTMGIRRIHIEDRKNEADIFAKMLESYFLNGPTTPEEIDFIIYTNWDSVVKGDPWGISEEECINVPYYLQKRFNMTHAQVFNVEQDCTGTLVGARIAYSLINEGSARKILLLSRNILPKLEYRLMGGVGLISDGLALMEISLADSGLALIDFAADTDGNMSMDKDFSQGINQAKVVKVGANLIKSLVQKNNLTMKDISIIIPQNISKSVWTFYCQLLEFPVKKVFLDNFGNAGHMGDVDIICNITDVTQRNLLPARSFAMVYGIGTGTSWNALLLQAL
jgi:3-oxoacyl-[acyl-carrier-protein] synthase III